MSGFGRLRVDDALRKRKRFARTIDRDHLAPGFTARARSGASASAATHSRSARRRVCGDRPPVPERLLASASPTKVQAGCRGSPTDSPIGPNLAGGLRPRTTVGASRRV